MTGSNNFLSHVTVNLTIVSDEKFRCAREKPASVPLLSPALGLNAGLCSEVPAAPRLAVGYYTCQSVSRKLQGNQVPVVFYMKVS
jgi:hypothetical protein